MLFCCFMAVQNTLKAQLQIVPETTALALVQKLLGQGVTVTNVSMVADLRATGFFNNRSGTSIGIDSGIVLSTGRVKTAGTLWGFDSDGTTEAQNVEASSGFALPGDLDLANLFACTGRATLITGQRTQHIARADFLLAATQYL